MDFLLIRVRIVLEVDGRHYYAVEDPKSKLFVANPGLYCSDVPRRPKVAAPRLRGLSLWGKRILRYVAQPDLDRTPISAVASEFFDKLLKKHGVI
jgi:hypothetical protein